MVYWWKECNSQLLRKYRGNKDLKNDGIEWLLLGTIETVEKDGDGDHQLKVG